MEMRSSEKQCISWEVGAGSDHTSEGSMRNALTRKDTLLSLPTGHGLKQLRYFLQTLMWSRHCLKQPSSHTTPLVSEVRDLEEREVEQGMDPEASPMKVSAFGLLFPVVALLSFDHNGW